MDHSAPPPGDTPTAPRGCARCGGNNASILEAEKSIRTLVRWIEGGTHTIRGRTALAQLPDAKRRLREERQHAADHVADAHGVVA